MTRPENGDNIHLLDRANDAGGDHVKESLKKVHHSPSPGKDSSHANSTAANPQGSPFKLLYCAAGIFVSFFVYGIFQERITRGVYGEHDRFHYTLTLVLAQCLVNAFFARIMIRVTREHRDTTPRLTYGFCALSYLGAMLSSNQALQYVNYPTQVLGKSCKPIPVMLFGVLFAHRRYSLKKYLFVLMIVIGVAIFFYESGKKHSKSEQAEIGYGEVLLVFSLFMDGVTGTIQERVRHTYKARSNSMMMWMNIFSSMFLSIVILITGELFTFWNFVIQYPQVIEHIATFCLCSALGQYFIFLTIAEFGPLPCSIITTSRKFFTILFSVIVFSNPISGTQWIATFFVFLGLVLDSKYGKGGH